MNRKKIPPACAFGAADVCRIDKVCVLLIFTGSFSRMTNCPLIGKCHSLFEHLAVLIMGCNNC